MHSIELHGKGDESEWYLCLAWHSASKETEKLDSASQRKLDVTNTFLKLIQKIVDSEAAESGLGTNSTQGRIWLSLAAGDGRQKSERG